MHKDSPKVSIYRVSCKLVLSAIFYLSVISSYAQNVGINPTGAAPNASAMLDINASPDSNKGLLIPRMTDAQRQSLPSPVAGLLIFNTSNNALDLYNGTGWQKISAGLVSTSSAAGSASTPPGVAINTSGQLPDPSAMLDVSSTTKGMLIPRILNTGTVATPVAGLIIYNTTTGLLSYYNGSAWVAPCQTLIDNIHGGAATAEGIAINTTGAPANASAMLDVSSTTLGLLIPPLSSHKRDAVPTPAPGLFIYNTTDKDIEYWTGAAWNALVSSVLTATATASPIPVCAGSQLTLTGVAPGGTSWKWTGPNGFTSFSQDTVITAGKLSAGTYTLNVSGGCGSSAPTTTAAVTVSDSVNASTNAPLCTGSGPIQLSGYASPTPVSWTWTGPNHFNSSSQNPTIPTTAGSSGGAIGTYTLTTSNGCGATTVYVELDTAVPANVVASATPNPACAGETVTMKGTGTNAPDIGIWTWNWPDGTYFGFIPDPDTFQIPGVLVYWGVTYSLQVFNTCGGSSTVSVNLTVDTIPNPPTAGVNTASATQIVWNWNASAGATGYQWNTTNTYPGVGVNTVASPTYTQPSLTCGTSYTLYVWAYNQCGNSTPSTALTQSTSACVIATVTCGTQTWTAANLNVGTEITVATTQAPGQKWCYNDLLANCTTYGGLYQWASAMNLPSADDGVTVGGTWQTCDPCVAAGQQGICPSGYHIPTDLEFGRYEWCVENNIAPTGSTPLSTFQSTVINRGSTTAGVGPGDKMKVTSSNTPSWDGTNTSGFGALPAGNSTTLSGGQSTDLGPGGGGQFWTALENGSTSSINHDVWSGFVQAQRETNTKTWGFSIRCIKN